MKISLITAREILDSRGMPTLRVTVAADAARGVCDVPSGASKGSHEAKELRDHDGKGVSRAIELIEGEIQNALLDVSVSAQSDIDRILTELDGTSDKSRLGANSLIGVSIAAAKAAAKSKDCALYEHLRSLADILPSRNVPLLFINLFNGGKHAPLGTPFQEHQIIPQTDDAREALVIAAQVYESLEERIAGRGHPIAEGDEGGIVSPVESVFEPFQYLHESLVVAGVERKVALGADIAASSIERDGESYLILKEKMTAANLSAVYYELKSRYNLTHIEDPFSENDFDLFATLQKHMRDTVIIGDDLTTTQSDRIARAAEAGSISAVIIKPNQIGTVSETLHAMQTARKAGIHCIASHRSGDTMDDFIADFAYAFGCYGLKAGAPHKQERRVKYERLVEIAYAS